jgi:chemotaxis protein methyltransferase CheR
VTVAPERFQYVQQLVMERSAIVLSAEKAYLVDARLAPLARDLGASDVNEVVDQVRSRKDPSLEQRVVEALTTNETSWFRDSRPFQALERQVFPELLRQNATTRRLRVWSAASSAGQELYSVAMLLEDKFPQLRAGWKVELVGTDLNTEMVQRASEGLYSTLEVNRGLPASMLVRFFDKQGAHWRVKQSLRDRVSFSRINLAGPWPPMAPFDVVLLRNVLIYFDMKVKTEVLCRAVKQLAPGGYVLLGTAESPNGLCPQLVPATTEGTVVYKVRRA